MVSLREHGEKVVYIVLGAVIAVAIGLFKERVIDVPDFSLESRICAPLTKVTASLENLDTGQVFPIPNAPALNPMRARFVNAGKKALEELEVVLEFVSVGDIDITDERYTTKPSRGFGAIEIVKDGRNRRTLRIALLNPGDELEYSAMGARPATVVSYAKVPGLSFYQLQRPGCGW